MEASSGTGIARRKRPTESHAHTTPAGEGIGVAGRARSGMDRRNGAWTTVVLWGVASDMVFLFGKRRMLVREAQPRIATFGRRPYDRPREQDRRLVLDRSQADNF